MHYKNSGLALFSLILLFLICSPVALGADTTGAAQFKLAEADFYIVNRGGTGNSAKGKLKRFIKDYPNSEYADDAYILISSFFLQRKSEKSAKKWLEKLAIKVPDSNLIAMSETYLARLKNIKSEFKQHNVDWYEQRKVLRDLGRELTSDYKKATASTPPKPEAVSTPAPKEKSRNIPVVAKKYKKPPRVSRRYFSTIVGQVLDRAAIDSKLNGAAGMSDRFLSAIDYRSLSAENAEAIKFLLEENILGNVKQAGDAINSKLKNTQPNYAEEYEEVIVHAKTSIAKINQVLNYWPNIDPNNRSGATALEKELSDILAPVRASVEEQLIGGVKRFESKYISIKNKRKPVANLNSEACKKARTMVPVASAEDYRSAKKMYSNERRYGAPYRSVEEIAELLAKVKHIQVLSDGCSIPVGDISLSRYFELTGRQF